MDNEKAIEKLAGIVENHVFPNNTAIAILAAIKADPLAYGIKPKPLVWVGDTAKTPFGSYTTHSLGPYAEGNKYQVNYNGAGIARCPTRKAAQAAAETHRDELFAKEMY